MDTWMMIAIGLVVVIAGLLIAASTKPDTFSMSRAVTIKAPADAIFPLIDSPREMNRWNPFLEPDPAVRLDYYGPDRGVGAGNRWDGNREVGAGSVEVIECRPASNVVMNLHMLKPMRADNRVEFTLRPTTGGTEVTWAISGRQPLIGKLLNMFIDCSKMVTGRFDHGLANLKSLVERQPEGASGKRT